MIRQIRSVEHMWSMFHAFMALLLKFWKVLRIGTVRYNWPISVHASQAFSIAHCTDSKDLPKFFIAMVVITSHWHSAQVSTALGKSSESVQCAVLKACDACADIGQL